ncbi:MAG: lysophospholipid acyltransferase family protein [Marinilabiliaceae bacterium]|nr:lysophospholipid acyltransferase family protein [Marinilabiliaceae bacterium]
MITARHHWLIKPFFDFYTRWQVKRHFYSVRIVGETHDSGLPLLVVANHVGWWDGFWINYLNLHNYGRRFHFMMLERQLRRFWFFRFAGGFSVNPGHRRVIETLRYAASLLSNHGNMVLVFPQGQMRSSYDAHIRFQKGLAQIIRHLSEPVQMLFVVNLFDYADSPKPLLTIYVKNYALQMNCIDHIESDYRCFYDECLTRQINCQPS